MDELQPIEVQALESKFLDDVVRLHLDGLGYTLNSALGPEHLRFLYHVMGEDQTCYVGVAMHRGVPVGVVSGTVDPGHLKSRLLRSMTIGQGIGIARAFIRRPALVIQWVREAIIGSAIRYQGEQIRATLTTLAVTSQFRRRGLGRELIRALERFFAARRVLRYRLETVVENEAARDFYGRLGFKDVDRRAGSYVLVKHVAQ